MFFLSVREIAIASIIVAIGPGTAFAGDPPARKFYVKDYGAIANHPADAGPGIRQAIADAVNATSRAEVVLEAGRYRIKPMEGSTRCLSLDGASNVTIRGQGDTTEIVVTDPRGEFLIASNCRNVSVKDLAIDYDPLPFTQGRVVATSTAAGTLDLDLDPGYPPLSAPCFNLASKFGLIIDGKRRQLKAGAADHVFSSTFTHLSDRVWRLTLNPDQRGKLSDITVGDRFVQMARQGFTTIGFMGSSNCTLENVTLYAAASLACALIANEGRITLRHYAIRFKPGSNRLLTANGDGVHCQQNRVGPTIENCHFEGMADDSINIYAPPCVVREVKSPTEWVTSIGAKIRPGDLLQILDPLTGDERCQVKAATVQEQNGKYLLTLQNPVAGINAGTDHRNADTIYNLSACGTGFIIRNNTMRNHRRHGVLIRGGDGLVEGNTIDQVAGLGVVLTNEPGWPEGPVPWKVVIRNNTITGGGHARGYGDSPRGASIQVQGIGLDGRLGENRPVHDITISANQIRNPPGAAIFIGAARKVRISGNTITASPEAPSYRECASLIVDNCANVLMKNNTITDVRAQTTAAVQISRSTAGGNAGVSIRALEAVLAPGRNEVIDARVTH